MCIEIGAAILLLSIPAMGQSRDIVVPNYYGSAPNGPQGVTIVNASTGATVHTFSFGAGAGPWLSGVTPDDKTAIIVDYDTNSVQTINLSTYAVSSPVKLPGTNPEELAIAPDGKEAYVTQDLGLASFDISTGTAGALIPAGLNDDGVAITPNGKTAYLSGTGNGGSHPGSVVPVNLVTRTPGTPIPVPRAGLPAVTPDGSTVWVQTGDNTLVPISTSTNTAGTPITLPTMSDPYGFAISPDGTTGYATDAGNTGALDQVNLTTRTLMRTATDANQPEWPVVMPDGKTVFTSNWNSGTLVPFSTSTLTVGTPIGAGGYPGQLGVVPNQAPTAAFRSTLSGATLHMNGSKSKDSDGTVARYEWNFGDGRKATTSRPKTSHRYAKAGRYRVTLTVVDNEGCSTKLVYTGQETSCTGAAAARVSHTVKLIPAVKIARSAKVRNGTARIGLACSGPGRCTGTLTLHYAGRSIGKAHFSIKAGGHATVSVRLTSAGRNTLASHGGRLTAVAAAAVRAGRTTKRAINLVATGSPSLTG
ncbi:MAG TPA: PKD domain-containing protein [Solirubrobacteraceae bacterium]|jgi:DNA-binding beta-propeller fold protein YncE|nr:PKD domain-containing protein [Solirubrobacteraceae bacterium]